MTGTFTCASCGGTFDKGWSDEEAAAEAEELFPGIDPSDPDEAAIVCDGCYEHIMGRVQAEAPELIGEGWRGEPSASEDPIGKALHADAEAAREEIRTAGLICPSCGQNAGDLFGRHCLVLITRTPVSREQGFGYPVTLVSQPECSCECRDGRPVILTGAGFETWQAAANIALMDDLWFRETIAFTRDVIGNGPGGFTGLLGTIGGEDR